MSINGQRYLEAASYASCSGSSTREVTYTLSGAYSTFSGVLGMRDETPAGAASIITIATNGTQILIQEVRPNQHFPFELDVSGANSLQLTVKAAGDVDCDSGEGPAIGNPQLLGTGVTPLAPTPVGGVSLFSLDAQSGGWGREPMSINGQRYLEAASYASCSGSSTREVTYTLSGAYSTFSGVLGMRDETPAGAASIITIATNGTQILIQEVRPNQHFPFELDVSGANSLQLTVKAAGDVDCDSGEGPAIGNPQLH